MEYSNIRDAVSYQHSFGYDPSGALCRWESFAASVASAISLQPGGRPQLQGLAFAGSDHGAGGFSPQQAYADGILSSTAGKLIGV